MPKPVLDRALAKVRYDSGCWEFDGARSVHGYGVIANPGGSRLAHRVVYEALVGPIPDGMTLDHLCRNPACVNPQHLEAVTHRENMHRGTQPKLWARNREKTHCPKGHEYTPENTRIKPWGGRECRRCGSLETSARAKRKREAARSV